MALTSAPTTKPSCTPMVSQALVALLKSYCITSCGTTADAENHKDMTSMTAKASVSKLKDLPVMRDALSCMHAFNAA